MEEGAEAGRIAPAHSPPSNLWSLEVLKRVDNLLLRINSFLATPLSPDRQQLVRKASNRDFPLGKDIASSASMLEGEAKTAASGYSREDGGCNARAPGATSDKRVREEATLRDEGYDEGFNLTKDELMASGIKIAMDVLNDALRLYGSSNIYVSFNGGKDATVMLYIYMITLLNYHKNSKKNQTEDPSVDHGAVDLAALKIEKPLVIYFSRGNDEIAEVFDFTVKTVKEWDLDLCVRGSNMGEEISKLMDERSSKFPLAFILGTRRGDPNCGNQSWFCPSSSWMPPFMRVNPILEWKYNHVWSFLLEYEMEYCSLYNDGYTSIGCKHNTTRNSLLRSSDGSFLPAYLLGDYASERQGRITSKCSVKLMDSSQEIEKAFVPHWRNKLAKSQTAALVVTGDEILKGQKNDTNSNAVIQKLRKFGIRLCHIAITRDTVSNIAQEVHRLATDYDFVICSGGVGPTYDDVTAKAVARALGQCVKINKAMVVKIREALKIPSDQELLPAHLKLAELPELVQLRTSTSSQWPLLQCENVFMLPGVPEFFCEKLEIICNTFLSNKPFFMQQLKLKVEELCITNTIEELLVNFSDVTVGSYPNFDEQKPYKTVITLESDSEATLNKAVGQLLTMLSEDDVLSVSSSNSI